MGYKNYTFSRWMQKVEEACWAQYDLSIYDLPDCCWRDWFDRGVSPASAASRARKNAE